MLESNHKRRPSAPAQRATRRADPDSIGARARRTDSARSVRHPAVAVHTSVPRRHRRHDGL